MHSICTFLLSSLLQPCFEHGSLHVGCPLSQVLLL
jgi:hypothetical protein